MLRSLCETVSDENVPVLRKLKRLSGARCSEWDPAFCLERDAGAYKDLVLLSVSQRTCSTLRRCLVKFLLSVKQHLEDDDAVQSLRRIECSVFEEFCSSDESTAAGVPDLLSYYAAHDLPTPSPESISSLVSICDQALSSDPCGDLEGALDALYAVCAQLPSPPSAAAPPPSLLQDHLRRALRRIEAILYSETEAAAVLSNNELVKAAMVVANLQLLIGLKTTVSSIAKAGGSACSSSVRLCLLRGYIAVFPLLEHSSYTAEILSYCEQYANYDAEVGVRHHSLKTIEVLFSRLRNFLRKGNHPDGLKRSILASAKYAMDKIVMRNWDNVGGGINSVLTGIFEVLTKISMENGCGIDAIIDLVLKEPNHSKVRRRNSSAQCGARLQPLQLCATLLSSFFQVFSSFFLFFVGDETLAILHSCVSA